MMPQAQPAAATYQDILDAPPHMRAELIDGRLHLQPRPAKRHTFSASGLGSELSHRFRKRGSDGWWILYEPELHLDAQVLVPDLVGWRRSTTPDFDWDVAYYEERPDWVCEVLSPSTARHDRIVKLDIYHSAQIPWVWLVDPVAETVEVYKWSEQGWLRTQTAEGRRSVNLSPFEAEALDLDVIWPPISG